MSESDDEQIRQLQEIIGREGKIERLPDGRIKMTLGGRTVYGLDPVHCVEMASHLVAVQAQSLAYDHVAIPEVIGDIVEQGNEVRRHEHYSLRVWWCDYREVAHWAVLQWDGSQWMMLAMGFCRNLQDANRTGLLVWAFTPKTIEDTPQ